MNSKDQYNLQNCRQPPSRDFILLAGTWCRNHSVKLLGFIWQAYDQMRKDDPTINSSDLERSITQLLDVRIRHVMSGDEPFYIQHCPFERETMKVPPAQPPQYDLGFILYADEQTIWPLEAKVLETDGNVSQYVTDIREEFLKCRYAPFSSEGAMLGYLLSGSPNTAFKNISDKVPCKLYDHPKFRFRPQKLSRHIRSVPRRKAYPATFRCHHVILEFPGLKRSKVITPSPRSRNESVKD